VTDSDRSLLHASYNFIVIQVYVEHLNERFNTKRWRRIWSSKSWSQLAC